MGIDALELVRLGHDSVAGEGKGYSYGLCMSKTYGVPMKAVFSASIVAVGFPLVIGIGEIWLMVVISGK